MSTQVAPFWHRLAAHVCLTLQPVPVYPKGQVAVVVLVAVLVFVVVAVENDVDVLVDALVDVGTVVVLEDVLVDVAAVVVDVDVLVDEAALVVVLVVVGPVWQPCPLYPLAQVQLNPFASC